MKQTVKPIWVYGVDLSKSNMAIIQTNKSKILRMTPWFDSNETLHKDLKVSYVKVVITEKRINRHIKPEHHQPTPGNIKCKEP